MIICRSLDQMRDTVRSWRRCGDTVGFVPTMGFLHDGHLSLVDVARSRSDRVVVSIYVNPAQFGEGEDLEQYPRDFERDETLCRQRGVDAVFYPDDSAMYAPDHSTWVVEEVLSKPLCGRSRPAHFRGVTTIVTKLFNIVQPDVAVFGRKDAQQALVIQRMVRDLNLPLDVVVAPIVREADGLALSSRNRYLSDDERRRAVSIVEALREARRLVQQGEADARVLCERVRSRIEAAGGEVDYVELAAESDLQPLARLDQAAVLAVAARFGSTRLIDNMTLG